MLSESVISTFNRRRTVIPDEVPFALTDGFILDETKRIQWKAFLRKSGISDAPDDLGDLIAQISSYLLPIIIG